MCHYDSVVFLYLWPCYTAILDQLAETGFHMGNAGIAQLVEQLICNQQVVGSNPTAGSLGFQTFDCWFAICAQAKRSHLQFRIFHQACAPIDQSADENESERAADNF